MTVNQLPNEILLVIFTFVQAAVEEDAAPDWLAVLLVCRRWFVVAATARQLWRELIVGKSLNFLRTGLIRSKGLTIGVSVIERDTFPATARTILPHVHRIYRLSDSGTLIHIKGTRHSLRPSCNDPCSRP